MLIGPFNESTFDTGTRVGELFPAVVLDTFSPYSFASFGVKTFNTSLSGIGKINPDATTFIEELHR